MTDILSRAGLFLVTALAAMPVAAQDADAPAPDEGQPTLSEPEDGNPAEDGDAEAQPDANGDAQESNGAATLPGGDLARGQAVGGEPQIYVREEHGDWEVRCLEVPEGQEDPCQLYQRLLDEQGNPTADVNFFDLPDGSEIVAGATVLTPLQTLLTQQVTMTIDGGQPRRYPFSFCDQSGCYARMGFTQADVQALRRGASATLVVVPALAPDQPARMRMSLSGFTAGLAAVEVENE